MRYCSESPLGSCDAPWGTVRLAGVGAGVVAGLASSSPSAALLLPLSVIALAPFSPISTSPFCLATDSSPTSVADSLGASSEPTSPSRSLRACSSTTISLTAPSMFLTMPRPP